MQTSKQDFIPLHVKANSVENRYSLEYETVDTTTSFDEAILWHKKNCYRAIVIEACAQDDTLLESIEALLSISSRAKIILIAEIDSPLLLTKLLNLGLYKLFTCKENPEEINSALEAIERASNRTILIDNYRRELEQKSRELSLRNEQLEKSISLLDAKVARFGGIESSMSDIEHISQEDILELGELEDDIEGILTLLSSTNTFDSKNQNLLELLFKKYAEILRHYNSYEDIAQHLNLLYESFASYSDAIDILDILELLESFIYVLKNWSLSFALNDFKNTQSYHASIINDITTIVAILKGEEEEFESDIEFF